MSLSLEVYLIILIVFLYVDAIIIIKLLLGKIRSREKREEVNEDKRGFIRNWALKREIKQSSMTYIKLRESIDLDYDNLRVDLKETGKLEEECVKALSSFSKLKRMEAAVRLGYLETTSAREALEGALLIEKDTPVRLYIANALSDIGDYKSIPVLVSSLINSHRWYRNKVNMLLIDFREDFNLYLPHIIERKESEIKELIVEYSKVEFSSELKDYLIAITKDYNINYSDEKYKKLDKIGVCCANCIWGRTPDGDSGRICEHRGRVESHDKCRKFKRLPVSIDGIRNRRQLAYDAAEVLAAYYPSVLIDKRYTTSSDAVMRGIAVKALSKGDTDESIDKLISLLKDKETAHITVEAIVECVDNNPELLKRVTDAFKRESDVSVKTHLSEILSHKIDYLLMQLNTDDKEFAGDIIREVLLLGRTSGVIGFMNKNKNIEIEDELVSIVESVVSRENVDKNLETEFCQYLSTRLLDRCNLVRFKEIDSERKQDKDQHVIEFIYYVLGFMILVFPVIFILRHFPKIMSLSFTKQLKTYVLDYNYYIAFYSVAISLVNMILIILSIVNARKQSRLWKLKTNSMLFKDKMLPGISIIAPAYNEEKTIIESANSLLNLVYPDYELIIVNDGSTDKTMNILIKTFDLKRVDSTRVSKLNTKHVRGVYINKSMPKLVVVDKINGGKADSLNAGINQSRKEYFCGIDADSILEPDALLKLASRELDAGIEMPALGGNVFPANGSTIEMGSIVEKAFPKNPLARFQTIEYIRAFMAGRMGWAYTNCLLIISGAFGLFRKERVIDVGGYLTSSGEYSKDTVGEDMELVVRIGKMMREKGLRYKIDYVYNANCWTEVPEDLMSLKRQRSRWHRGLIDILAFHRNMMFNPRYGRAGLVAMPYFFIFEFMGTFIEVKGYIMVILAVFLGLMNIEIATMLFISTIMLGTMISLSSLVIAQEELKHLRQRDILTLIVYSVLENFGPRQMMSIWRFVATMSLLWKQEEWGKAERKGFSASVELKEL